ncbi:hypothetical protein ABK040_012065 [Willaertia magna]
MSFNDFKRNVILSDIPQFDISFEGILDHEPTFNCLKDFLIESKSTELNSCLEKITEFRKMKSENKKTIIAIEIYDKFIKERSNNEINLPAEQKLKIKQIVNLLNNKTVESNKTTIENNEEQQQQLTIGQINNLMKQTFDELESTILIMIKESKFKTFLESDIFKKFIQTQKLYVLTEIGTPKIDSTFNYIHSLTNLNSDVFTINDFKFLKNKMLDNSKEEWDIVSQSKNHKCYLSTKTWDFGTSVGLQIFKFEVEFPYTVQQVMNTLCELEYRYEYDGELKRTDIVKLIDKEIHNSEENIPQNSLALASAVTSEIYKIIWPIADREFVGPNSAIYDPNSNSLIIGMKTMENKPYLPEAKKGVIRGNALGGWLFQPINNNNNNNETTSSGTRYIQLFYMDFKGKLPKAIIKKSIIARSKRFYKLGMKYLEKNEKRGFICNDDAGLFWCLKQNGSVAL